MAAACVVMVPLASEPAVAALDDVAKTAAKLVRDAERKMHGGKNDEAELLLNEAAGMIERIKAEDPDNKKLKSLESKYERTRKALNRKMKKPGTPAAPSRPAAASASGGSPNKLPGGVTKRLRDIDRELDGLERRMGGEMSESLIQQVNYKLQTVDNLFAEIDKNYSGQFSPEHPDYQAARARREAMEAAAAKASGDLAAAKSAAGEAEQRKKAQSAQWTAKLRPYVASKGTPGYSEEKYLVVPGTSEPEKFPAAIENYNDVKALYEAYQKTEFPDGKTWELEDLAEKKIPYAIKTFESSLESHLGIIIGQAEERIDQAMAYLDRDTGWKSDPAKIPNLLDHKRRESIEGLVKNVAALGSAGGDKVGVLQKGFEALLEKDQANRQIRKERTYMKPDRFQGSRAGDIKAKAEALVKRDEAGGQPLRTTIISEDWKEETVKEWTDTTKTAWRVRTTQSVTAQVAAKGSTGVRLYTVHVAKDKRTDGSWGPLYGNLHQYSHLMLEQNVHKDGP
jgi:hypothetical protein